MASDIRTVVYKTIPDELKKDNALLHGNARLVEDLGASRANLPMIERHLDLNTFVTEQDQAERVRTVGDVRHYVARNVTDGAYYWTHSNAVTSGAELAGKAKEKPWSSLSHGKRLNIPWKWIVTFVVVLVLVLAVRDAAEASTS